MMDPAWQKRSGRTGLGNLYLLRAAQDPWARPVGEWAGWMTVAVTLNLDVEQKEPWKVPGTVFSTLLTLTFAQVRKPRHK